MKKRIGVFGDSIVRGHCDYQNGGWARKLQIEGFSEKTFTLFELGISGDTTEEILKRAQIESKARSLNMIIYAVGLNDAARWDKVLRVNPEQFKKNIKDLHEIASDQGAKVAFVGLTRVDESFSTPVSWDDTLHYLIDDVGEYDVVLKNFCSDEGCLYIDMKDVLDDEDLMDGVHPTTEGHTKMYKKIKKSLEENNYIKKENE